MPKVRLNDICRELHIKTRQALDYLHQKGLSSLHHSSSLDEPLARELRSHFAGLHASIPQSALSERDRLIASGIITPNPVRSVRSATSRAFDAKSRSQKKPAKYQRCRECRQYILKTDMGGHMAAHRRRPRPKSNEVKTHRTFRIPSGTPKVKIVRNTRMYAVATPVADPRPKPPREVMCRECHRLVHPADIDRHMSEYHSHTRLPDIRTAQSSFVLLPPGHDWEYRTVFDHYLHKSRAHSFGQNVIDWTRIAKITKYLKPTLRSFGVRGWFGYAVYAFPYTSRVVVECPIEGNATYILWGDWQSKVQLTKGELRHKYPNQHVRVIHQGNWIEEVRRALREI